MTDPHRGDKPTPSELDNAFQRTLSRVAQDHKLPTDSDHDDGSWSHRQVATHLTAMRVTAELHNTNLYRFSKADDLLAEVYADAHKVAMDILE